MGVNKAKIAEWHKKHGAENVKKLTVKGRNGEEWQMYFVDPQVHPKRRSIYSRSISLHVSNQKMESGEVILNECFLDGDEVFRDNNHMAYITAAIDLGKSIEFLPSTITST